MSVQINESAEDGRTTVQLLDPKNVDITFRDGSITVSAAELIALWSAYGRKPTEPSVRFLQALVRDLPLSTRAKGVLTDVAYTRYPFRPKARLGDVSPFYWFEFKKVENCGKRTQDEILAFFDRAGIPRPEGAPPSALHVPLGTFLTDIGEDVQTLVDELLEERGLPRLMSSLYRIQGVLSLTLSAEHSAELAKALDAWGAPPFIKDEELPQT